MIRKSAPIAAYLGLSLLWGSAWIGGGVVSGRVPPLRFSALRFATGALLLATLAIARRSSLPQGPALRANLWLGLTIVAMPYALVVWAGQRSSPVLPILLFAGLPAVAALLGRWLSAASAPRTALQASLIGIGGVALVISNGLSFSLSDIAGGVAILVAVLSQAASLVSAKRLLREAPLLSSTAIQLGTAAAILWPLSAVMEHSRPSQWRSASIATVIVLGTLASGVGFLLYYRLLGRMEPYQVATLQWTLPLVAIVESAIVARELPPWTILAGYVVVLASLYAVISARSQDDRPVTLHITGHPLEEHRPNLR